MKKLAIAQIILGALIIGSVIYWLGWLSDGYHILEGTTPNGHTIHTLPLLAPNPPMDVWTLLQPSLGLAVLGCGIAQLFRIRNENLAIAQIVLGGFIISSLVWFTGWVEYDYGALTIVRDGYGEIEMHRLPEWIVRLTIWKTVSFILSLLVIGTGIVQLTRLLKRSPSIILD